MAQILKNVNLSQYRSCSAVRSGRMSVSVIVHCWGILSNPVDDPHKCRILDGGGDPSEKQFSSSTVNMSNV